MLHVEEFIDMLLQSSAFWRVLTCHLVSLLQLVLDDRSRFVDFQLIPSLLQEVSAVVVASVSVTEGDVFDVVTHHLLGTWREIIVRVVHQQGMATHNHIDKHGLATAVGTYDGDVLSLASLKIYGFRHTPFWHTGNTFLYFDNRLHCLYLVSFFFNSCYLSFVGLHLYYI